MENSSEILKRLNNKLGGFGLPDGSRVPANWNGASFRDLSSFLQEICDPSSQLLDNLIEPNSAAYFPKLHLRAQERILTVLLEVSTTRIERVRSKLSTLLDISLSNTKNVSKDELLLATWIPRLTMAVLEVHGFSNNEEKQETNIIDQDANSILQMLAPVATNSTDNNTTSLDIASLQHPQDLKWGEWHAGEKKQYDVESVSNHMSKVGLTRHYPYEVLVGGQHKNDKIKNYMNQLPPCVQQMYMTPCIGSDVDFKQMAKPNLGSNTTNNYSSTTPSSSFSSNPFNHSNNNNSSKEAQQREDKRRQEAQIAQKIAAEKAAQKAAQVQKNFMNATMNSRKVGSSNYNKRSRSELDGVRQTMTISVGGSSSSSTSRGGGGGGSDGNKKQAIPDVSSGRPTSSPRNYVASLHESKLNEMLQMVKNNAPSKRLQLIKQNNEFMQRLKDFATGAPEMRGAIHKKTGKQKTFFTINLSFQNRVLSALHLDYKTLQCTIKKVNKIIKK
jgi:hypothetical protein